jgi:predicted lipoprotein with Yx(FWY)xxD motif
MTPEFSAHPRRSWRWKLVFGVGVIPLIAAACSSPSTPATQAAGSGGATTLETNSTSLGSIVTDGGGRSVYLFEKDSGTMSACYDACAAQWPPVTTSGQPSAKSSVRASLVGTTARTGGTTQVTYAGHPLYYYAGDVNPGSVSGQGLQSFGAGWDVLRPSGQKVDSAGR